MRAIVLASTALLLTLSLASCDKSPTEVFSLTSTNKCRDAKGRFAKGCVVCPDGTVLRLGQTADKCPVQPPPEPEPIGLEGLPPIQSAFDRAPYLGTAPIPASAAPDVVGAFRFICTAGQLLKDDPIVYPGQPGASHLHQFYGNTGANAHSTYASLRKSGESTCVSILNRSAYWMPAMLDGKGNVVRPDHVQIYYKRRPKSDPPCSNAPGTPITPLKSTDQKYAEGFCIDLPNGLKFVFGFDMITNRAPTGSFDYICNKDGTNSPAFKTLAAASGFAQCSPGGRIVVRGKAPGCTDGRLDSPNHRDHVAYAVRDPNYGFMACPKTHPYVIAGFSMLSSHSIAEGDDLRLWSLSSDAMHPNLPKGSTYHADFFMAWDPVIKQMWHDNCINKMLNCSSGVLGNGQMMKPPVGFSWSASPRLVRVPA